MLFASLILAFAIIIFFARLGAWVVYLMFRAWEEIHRG